MSVISENYKKLIYSVGRMGAHTLFPNDFEYYMCAFELVDSKGDVDAYFSFPVMPSSIEVKERKLTSIVKTLGGVSITSTSDYIPKDIRIQGNFGRKFKVLFNNNDYDNFVAFNFKRTLSVIKQAFSPKIKTGYGATKILQGILNASNTLDRKGKPYRLHFYNLALGENYIVEILDFELNQNKNDSNMMWGYGISMQSVSPLEINYMDNKLSLLKATSIDNLQKLMTNLFWDTKGVTSAAFEVTEKWIKKQIFNGNFN